MSTLANNYDTIDNLIYTEGLRITSIDFQSSSRTMIVHLTHRLSLKVPMTVSSKLVKGTDNQLRTYQLIGKGTGIHWPELDEDLSLKGFLREYLRQKVNTPGELVIA